MFWTPTNDGRDSQRRMTMKKQKMRENTNIIHNSLNSFQMHPHLIHKK